MSEEKCSDKHDVLYHYTTMDGFRGIIETQSLWATHYQHLNDSSELARFKAILPDFLVPTIKQVIKGLRAEGRSPKLEINKAGSRDKLAKSEAQRLSNIFFESAFAPINENKTPLFEPFITSFCSLRKDDEYVRNHGLLSMWRSYGLDGGVALVMDTQKLERSLRKEQNEYRHPVLKMGDVVYESDNKSFQLEFGNLIKIVKKQCRLMYEGESFNSSEFLDSYLVSVARLKHQAFKEEREVRIITMPLNERTFLRSNQKTLKPKKEMSRLGQYGDIRYLELFDGSQTPRLPIKKIIVGPHREQQKRFDEIKQATKHLQDVEVTCSETPYIEGK